MKTKCLEIRDSMTFIPVCASDVAPDSDGQIYLLRRAGYHRGNRSIILVNLNDCRAANDPYSWNGSRTMTTAHLYIEEHWDELSDGDVVDVEFILGETKQKKVSERFER